MIPPVLLLALIAGPTSEAAPAQARYEAQLGPLNACVTPAVNELAPGPGTTGEVAEAVMLRCQAEIETLYHAYQAAAAAIGEDGSGWRDNVAAIRSNLQGAISRLRAEQPQDRRP